MSRRVVASPDFVGARQQLGSRATWAEVSSLAIRNAEGQSFLVRVELGGITLDGKHLSQAAAIQLAIALTESVRDSQDVNQIGTPAYNRTENIVRRAESHLGRSLFHLRKVFG